MTFDEWLDQGHRCGCNENMRKAWSAALESRVLAERNPVFEPRVIEDYGQNDPPVVLTHPTPDDAKRHAVMYRLMRAAALSDDASEMLWKATEGFEPPTNEAEYDAYVDRCIAIDAAMQADKETK